MNRETGVARLGWAATLAIAVVAVALIAALAAVTLGRQATSPPPVPPPPPGSSVPTGPHPTPVGTVFEGCPPEGRGGDPESSQLKNRVDTAAWQATTVEALLALSWPVGAERKPRAEWTSSERAQIATYDGVPVQVEGYLLLVQAQGPEATNCDSTTNVDYHLWLVATPDENRATHRVVVAVTPRIRVDRSTWTVDGLETLAQQRTRVRISGWLFFDPDHPDEVGKSRGTLWEIHPVLQIETSQPDGGWKQVAGDPTTTGTSPASNSLVQASNHHSEVRA